MAAFQRYGFKFDVSTHLTTAQSVAASTTTKDVIIGLNVASNRATGTGSITASVYIESDVVGATDADYYLAKDILIPEGGSVELVVGKVLLGSGDTVKVVATEDVDVWMSVLEDV